MKNILKDKRSLFLGSLGILLLLVLSGLFFYVSSNTHRDGEYDVLIREGNQLVESKEFYKAYTVYSDAVELDSTKASGYKGIVKILHMKNRDDEIVKVYNDVKDSLTEDELAKFDRDLYEIFTEAEIYDYAYEAAKYVYLKSGDSEDGGNVVLAAIRANELQAAQDYEKKISKLYESADIVLYRQYLSQISSKDTSLNEMAELSKKMLEKEYPYLAIDLLERYSGDVAEYWEYYMLLGRAYFETGAYEKATDLLTQAVALGSRDYTVYLYLARGWYSQQNLDQSFKYYDRALSFADTANEKLILTEYLDILFEKKRNLEAGKLIDFYYEKEGFDVRYYSILYAYFRDDTEVYEKLMTEESESVFTTSQQLVLDEYWVTYLIDNQLIEDAQEYLVTVEEDTNIAESNRLYLSGLIDFANSDYSEGEKKLMRAIELDLEGGISAKAQQKLNSLI